MGPQMMSAASSALIQASLDLRRIRDSSAITNSPLSVIKQAVGKLLAVDAALAEGQVDLHCPLSPHWFPEPPPAERWTLPLGPDADASGEVWFLARHQTGVTVDAWGDGLLVVGPDANGKPVVRAAGEHATLIGNFPGVAVEDLRGKIIAPGFVDMHIHYPQTDVIGAPAAGLLPWLENYTFPHESRFNDEGHAREVAGFFFDELQRHGVTTALTFATSHPQSVDAAFKEAQARGLRFITGKVLQDRHSPDGVRDDTEQSLLDTEALIQRWHGVDRLGYAITPRFAPTSTDAQLRGAGELAARHPDVWVQSHVAENKDEKQWGFGADVTDDGRLAVINIWTGSGRKNGLMLLPPSAFFLIGLIIWALRSWKTVQQEKDEFSIAPNSKAQRSH